MAPVTPADGSAARPYSATRASFLPFNLPTIGEEEIQLVVETLRSGWLTTGPRAKQFERDFADVIGARHAVAVNSATAGLHLALEALGVRDGDEVIVPTMTFAATAEVAAYLRATPVLVDCDPRTLNMDPAAVAAAITPRTKVIIPVHFAGQPCDMDAIRCLADRHNLKIVEDAAHALPASYKGRSVGTLGDIACFSFYATKTLTTGEGGMIVTNDETAADRMRLMSLHGISRDAWKRYSSEGSWFYDIADAGYKYNLTDIAAALGIAQLRRCGEFWEARRRIAARYDEALANVPEIRRPSCTDGVEHSWHLYVIQLEIERLRVTRDEVMVALREANIGASVHFIPLHLHSYYRERFGYRRSDFPKASDAFDRILTLPLYPRLSDSDIQNVVDALRHIISANRR